MNLHVIYVKILDILIIMYALCIYPTLKKEYHGHFVYDKRRCVAICISRLFIVIKLCWVGVVVLCVYVRQ